MHLITNKRPLSFGKRPSLLRVKRVNYPDIYFFLNPMNIVMFVFGQKFAPYDTCTVYIILHIRKT